MTPGGHGALRLPAPRGPLSAALFDRLRGRAGFEVAVDIPADLDPWDDDAQLALHVLQQLALRPVAGVDDAWEHAPAAVALRLGLERRLEAAARAAVAPAIGALAPGASPADAVVELVESADGPSLSSWLEQRGTADHVREFAVHRAAYQLREADPHSFAIPRLPPGDAKTALLDIQLDEYGPEPGEAHAQLFATTMRGLGLDPGAGPDLDRLPATTLATNTLLGLLGSCRRLVGALLGHLAVFEMTSVEPMARYAATIRRVLPAGVATEAARFYDVHVAADGRHQHVALDMVRAFAAEDPDHAADVVLGAATLLHIEGAFTDHLLACWEDGRSSLRDPLPGSALRAAGDPAPLRLAG